MILVFKVNNFKFLVKTKWTFVDIFEYEGTDFTIDHFKVGISLYSFWISQIYIDNVVSFEYRLCLNEFVWLLYLGRFCLDSLILMRYICMQCPALGTVHLMSIHLSFYNCMVLCFMYGYSITFYCEMGVVRLSIALWFYEILRFFWYLLISLT